MNIFRRFYRRFAKSKNDKGTTLIELLVTLAITGMLVGIALPLFSYYQKRSVLDEEVRNFVSLFNYARALQNNPADSARIASSEYHYVIKITNSGADRKAELYAKNNPTAIIDSIKFSERVQMAFQDIGVIGVTGSGDGQTLEFSGFPPNETIGCSTSCTDKVSITLTIESTFATSKTTEVLNSKFNASKSLERPLSVSIK